MHTTKMMQLRVLQPMLVTGFVLAAFAAGLVPYAAMPLPIYHTALSALMAAAVLAMLLASMWLAAQAQLDGKPARMMLAFGFAFTAATLVPYGLLVPDLFPHVAPLARASAQASAAAWLDVVWHVTLLSGIAGFLAFNARFPSGTTPEIGRIWTRTFGFGGVVLWLAAVPAALRLPGTTRFINGMTPLGPARDLVFPLIAFLVLLTLLVHGILRRQPCMLDRFLGVACAATLLEVYASHVAGSVYTVGWYFARLDVTLLAAATLVVLIVESLVTSARLTRTMGRLASEANHDMLTGLPNRRFFESEGERAIESARHHKLPTAVGLVDIDLFKSYNDTFGHAAGDSCLRRVATLISECLWRPGDFVARLGGEEFVLVLPATDTIGAYFVMERIRETLAQAGLPAPSGGPLTVSIGVAELQPGDSLTDALSRADVALYQAKDGGRDRVQLNDLPEFELSFARRAG